MAGTNFWADGRRAVFLCNPLPMTLRHYALEFSDTITRITGAPAEVGGFAVERLGLPAGRIRLLCNALRNARATHGGAIVLQAWPSLGLLEPWFWLRRRGFETSAILFHDPVPLRQQAGFGSFARRLAQVYPAAARGVPIICHSDEAMTCIQEIFPRAEVFQARHPVLSKGSAAVARQPKTGVLIAGQFKPTRDLSLISAIGIELARRGVPGYIAGRGWPQSLTGWTVQDRFLSEAELRVALSEAGVLFLPYMNYFQSGIAIRALEEGTPVIGARTSFLEDLSSGGGVRCYEPRQSTQQIADLLIDGVTLRSQVHTHSRGPDLLSAYRREVDEDWRVLLARLTSRVA